MLVVVVAAVLELKAALRPHLEQQTQAAVVVEADMVLPLEQVVLAAQVS